MKRKVMFKLLFALMASGAIAAAGQLLTFDDLVTGCYSPITNGYAGFNWTNVWVADGVCLGDGYLAGTASPTNVAFNGFGGDAAFSIASGTFNLTSAYVTSVIGTTGTNITVKGYNGNTLLYSNSYPVNGTAPSFITFDYNDITEVYITGGKFALDNITINGQVAEKVLTIVPSGTNVLLTWPTNATGFTLQSTTNLVSPILWSTNSPGPVVVNGKNIVTNAIFTKQQFFRLTQ